METLYHFTDEELWKGPISKEGLIPYNVYNCKGSSLKCDLERDIKRWARKDGYGIWLWPKITDDLITSFFKFHSHVKGTKRGVVLECRIPSEHLMTHIAESNLEPGDTYRISHTTSFTYRGLDGFDETRRDHDDITANVAVMPVSPDRLRVVKTVGHLVISHHDGVTTTLDGKAVML